jgi:hypothetical protein
MTSLNAKLLAALLVVSAAAPALAAQVDHREANQQARIAEGRESGQLTHRETTRLERKEARIHRQARYDRAANHGHLSRAERRHVNREQNRVSRQIYRAKHNARHV